MFKFAYGNKLKIFLDNIKELSSFLSDLELNFKKQFGVFPSDSEKEAWKNLLCNLQNVLSVLPNELDDLYIFIEFGMPFSSARADILLLGKKGGKLAGIIVEHKQWSDDSIQVINGILYVMGKEELHPYYQAEAYSSYLIDYVEELHDVDLKSVAYLPNLKKIQILRLDPRIIIFGKNSEDEFSNFILDTFDEGLSEEELNKFLSSRFSPAKTLVTEVVNAINQQRTWTLLDEQRLVFESIKRHVQDLRSGDKIVFIVKGGPGTGKSAIALHLLGFFLKNDISAIHITNSSAFTTTLKGILLDRIKTTKNRLNGMFKLSHNFIKAKPDSFDVAICDEAHRFRKSTNLRWLRSSESQIYQIINASKLSMFFVDENQIVRPGENGTIDHIKNQAKRHNAKVLEYELKVQFRNAGNENFVKWLDYILELKPEPIEASSWKKDFEFRIFDSIGDLEQALSDKIKDGYSARILAGFVWPWNDPDKEGNLPLDVQIGNWKKPWNRKKPSGRNIDPVNDPYFEWATRKNNQLVEVGCIYSAQGFEFDYVGVIFGTDLVIRDGKWSAQPSNSFDILIKKRKSSEVLPLLKNTYRVLLSRGMRGCYVYFLDNETKEFFEKHFR